MKMIKEGKISDVINSNYWRAERNWRGICSYCNSEWEALQSELNDIKTCVFTKKRIAHINCDFCNNKSPVTMYPTNDCVAVKTSNECDCCHNGYMIKELNKVYLTAPVKYKYNCNYCGHLEFRFD